MSSSSEESARRERIRRKIKKLREELKTYKNYKEDFEDGKKKFEKARSGIVELKGTQYDKVKSNCEEAIGNEEELLDALQVKNINMDLVVDEIISEVNNGIGLIEEKIDEINSEISNLQSQL